MVQLCRRVLEKEGFQVVTATSPSQALAVLARQPIGLLLADFRMPGLDGFQLLSLARRHQPDLATIVMTGYGTVETAIEALHNGADGLILKPFNTVDLVANVRQTLYDSQQKRDVVRLRALRPLFEITEALFAEKDPERLQELIVDTVCERLNCSRSGLFWINQDGMRLDRCICRANRMQIEVDEDEYRLFQLVSQRAPLLVNREVLSEAELKVRLEKVKIRSLMIVSLNQSESRVYLVAARGEEDPIFRDADLEMFLILSRQASAALENARLYAELNATIRQAEKTQQAMMVAQKMASAGRLTASIAHEINNPLQSLHNCLHLAERKELSPSEREKYLHMAQSELDRLMATVQRMLDFYRPGARDRKLTDVNDLVERVLALMEKQLEQGKVSVQTEFAADLPRVMLVANQFQQVLINLILNAMEAMPDGGRITIQTARCETGSRNTGSLVLAGRGSRPAVEITITDTGPGIQELDRDRVFEPFYSTKDSGTGLGLAVSYGIVSAHGGTLTLVNSTVGASFRITLPEEGII